MALRDLVKDVHDQAENSPFAKLLMSGEIPEIQYANYLYQQKLKYNQISSRSNKLKKHIVFLNLVQSHKHFEVLLLGLS